MEKLLQPIEIDLVLPLKNLQFFAAGENNDLPVRSYAPQFRQLLQAVFRKRAYFADFFGGGIEALDGVTFNENAFTVKTSDIPVVVGTYNTGANVAFGTGTANSTRFGELKEIIYVDTPVPYTHTWAIHEGIDRFTVNADFNAAIADRLELQAQAKVQMFDNIHAEFIESVAAKTHALATLSDADIVAMFDDLDAYYTDIESFGSKVFKCDAALYNAILKHPLSVYEKGSSVDIDRGEILWFYGFAIEKVPAAKLPTGIKALVYVVNVGKTFTGINTVRTKDTEDFDGVKLQGAGKLGNFIIEDNKKAVAKVTFPVTP